jgi:putative nucleotidyltransferase with HDIG domain
VTAATVSPIRVDRLRALPSLPQVVLDVQAALAREDISLDDVAETVSLDQGLTAKALRIANCSFYGVPTRVVSIRQAIGVLGLRSVSTLLMTAAISECFPRVACRAFSLRGFWRHSVGVALCARQLARRLRVDADVAFTAGLLHDLGRLVLATLEPDALEAAYRHRDREDCQMPEAELAALGTDHAAVGAEVGLRWHFGQAVVDAVRLHHRPPAASAVNAVDIVHVADNVVHALDVAGDRDEMVPALDPGAWSRIGLGPDDCLALFEETEAELEGLCRALGV